MFVGAHLAVGLLIGKATGNYPAALVGAMAIDVDHLWVYARHRVLLNPKKFWKTSTDTADPYGNQRNYLHSFFTWIVVSILAIMLDRSFGIAFSLGYASHLLLDLLDKSDFYPFYPLKFKIRGFIKYYSKTEFIFTASLFLLFFIL
jgi:hypothetical protein